MERRTRKLASVLIGLALTTALLLVVSSAALARPLNPSQPTEVWVAADGSGDFTTIQAGVNAVAPGGIVYVAAGAYYETVDVDKLVELVGAGRDVVFMSPPVTALVNGGPYVGFDVTADGVSISGFHLSGYDFGIRLDDADECFIGNNTLVNNGHGIYLTGHENNNFELAPQQDFIIVGPGSNLNLIVGNNIENNVFLANSGVHVDLGLLNAIHFNNIVGNLTHGVWSAGTTVFAEPASGPTAETTAPWFQDARQNWWGDRSGPLHEPPAVCNDCVPPGPEGGWNCYECDKNLDGQGDRVSDGVIYCPWLGARVAEAECEPVLVPGAAEDTKTGGDVGLDAQLDGTTVTALQPDQDGRFFTLGVCTARYEDNPGGPHDFFSAGYYDVWVKGGTSPNSIIVGDGDQSNGLGLLLPVTATIEFCPADAGATAYYWDGFDWLPCSDQVYDAGQGCVVVTVHGETEPDFAYLAGGPFAVGQPPLVGGATVAPEPLRVALPAAVLLALVGMTAGFALLARRRRA
jgi:parallel beta-helix repeat protein